MDLNELMCGAACLLYEIATKPLFLQVCWSKCEVSELSGYDFALAVEGGGVYVLKQVQGWSSFDCGYFYFLK